MATLIQAAKMNNVDPKAWLADVLARIAERTQGRLDELFAVELAHRRRRPPQSSLIKPQDRFCIGVRSRPTPDAYLQGDFGWYAAALFGGAGGYVAGVLAALAINDWLLRGHARSAVTIFIVGIATLGGVAELYLSSPPIQRQLFIGANLFGAWIATFEVLVMRRSSN